MTENEKIRQHEAICAELTALYKKKNRDYGDAFHVSFLEEGMAMPRIRLGDKFNRFKNLTRSGLRQVVDESIRDTLIDLANYAILTVMEIDNAKPQPVNGCSIRALAENLTQKGGAEHGKESRTERVPQQE